MHGLMRECSRKAVLYSTHFRQYSSLALRFPHKKTRTINKLPWFRLVAARGWHWIGRVRNRDFVLPSGCKGWFPAKQLYQRATNRAQDLGRYRTVRNNPLTCRLVLIKNPPTGRKCRYASGKERLNTPKRKVAACNREPWIILILISKQFHIDPNQPPELITKTTRSGSYLNWNVLPRLVRQPGVT